MRPSADNNSHEDARRRVAHFRQVFEWYDRWAREANDEHLRQRADLLKRRLRVAEGELARLETVVVAMR